MVALACISPAVCCVLTPCPYLLAACSLPACFCSPCQSPSTQSPLRKKPRASDDSELDLTGSGAGGSKSPKVRGEKGAASFTSIADAADHIATRLATGLMDAVSTAAQALQVGGQAKLNAMQEIASGMQSKLNAKLEEIQAISDGIKAQMRALGEENAELRAFTDWVPEWGVLNKQQKVECINCSLYFALHGCPNKNHKKCTWLHHNGGRAKDKMPSNWSRAVAKHEGSAMHKWCAQHAAHVQAHPMGAIGAAMEKQREQAGANSRHFVSSLT